MTILAGLVCGASIASCKSHSKEPPPPPTTAPAPQETWNTQPILMPPQQQHAVKEGSLPLVYMVESATSIRVVDETDHQDLLKIPVPAHTIIGVDANKGVSVGGATMKLGPLPGDHKYAIYLESSEENIVRSGTIRPGRPAKPSGASTQGAP
jgi:hypothetical protein